MEITVSDGLWGWFDRPSENKNSINKLTFSNEDVYELDVVFRPAGQPPLIIECKSGEFRQDIEKYVRLRKRLNLPAAKFIVGNRFGRCSGIGIGQYVRINLCYTQNINETYAGSDVG